MKKIRFSNHLTLFFYFDSLMEDFEKDSHMNIPLVELKYLLKQSCSRETSDAPDKWTQKNPTQGHCFVTACIVQDFLGYRIKKALFPKEWADKLGSRSHYWNEVCDANGMEIIDLSRAQFPPDFPYEDLLWGKTGELCASEDWRSYGLDTIKYPKTVQRYTAIKTKVDVLLNSNSLFSDEKFQRCWKLAFSGEAVCPKMRFACLVYDGDKLITQSTNKNFTKQFGKERLCSFDGSSCIRMGIASRMDATLGDCDRVSCWFIKQVLDLGYRPADLKRFDFYEGGFWPDGAPWERSEPSYSCTYCQNMFAIFGLDKIYGAFGGAWHPLWTKDSLYSSTEYAKGEKKA